MVDGYENLSKLSIGECLSLWTGCPISYMSVIQDPGDAFRMMQYQFGNSTIAARAPGKAPELFKETNYLSHSVDQPLPGFHYPILQVREVQGHRLLQLGNPWGIFSWKGSWSRMSPFWTTDMKELLGKNEDKDSFWIGIEDFVKLFTGVLVIAEPEYINSIEGSYELHSVSSKFEAPSSYLLHSQENGVVYISLC